MCSASSRETPRTRRAATTWSGPAATGVPRTVRNAASGSHRLRRDADDAAAGPAALPTNEERWDERHHEQNWPTEPDERGARRNAFACREPRRLAVIERCGPRSNRKRHRAGRRRMHRPAERIEKRIGHRRQRQHAGAVSDHGKSKPLLAGDHALHGQLRVRRSVPDRHARPVASGRPVPARG